MGLTLRLGLTACTIAVLAAVSGANLASAQQLQSQDIIEKLTLKKKLPAKRGLDFSKPKDKQPQSGLKPADAAYIKALPKRGLSVHMKKQVAAIMDSATLPTINIELGFAYDSDQVLPESVHDLNALGQALTDPKMMDYRILLNGHTDAAGSDAYNMDLSERRAASVRDYLISHFGIDGNRLIAIGFGEERLKRPDHPEAAENRRVEVVNVGG